MGLSFPCFLRVQCQLLLWNLAQLLALFRKITWLKYNSLRSDKIPSDFKLQKSIKIYTYLQQPNSKCLKSALVRIHFRLTKWRNENVSLSFLPVSFVSSTLQTKKLCIWIAKNQTKAYFKTGGKRKQLKNFQEDISTYSTMFSSQVVPLYGTPSNTYIWSQNLT